MNEEDINIEDENLVDKMIKQNQLNRNGEGLGGKSTILEVDMETREQMPRPEKINIERSKWQVFEHYRVKRCYNCWGRNRIAKNCKRQEMRQVCRKSQTMYGNQK